MDSSKYTLNVGLGITGSFCTHSKLIKFLSDIKKYNPDLFSKCKLYRQPFWRM